MEKRVRIERRVAAFLWRVLLGAAATTTAYWILGSPLAVYPWSFPTTRWMLLVLYAPIDALNSVLPSMYRWDSKMCFGYTPWARYEEFLAIGTVAYSAVLSAPLLCRMAWRRFRRRIRTSAPLPQAD